MMDRIDRCPLCKKVISLRFPLHECTPPPSLPLSSSPEKTYVIRHALTGLYLTKSKGKDPSLYWGRYIGTPGKRFVAVRYKGGEKLDNLLLLNPKFEKIEVKK